MDIINSKRIMIIGSAGSGKSTLAIALSKSKNIPVVHLDKLFWQPNWIMTPKNEWHSKQIDLVKEDTWIIDGNYGSSMDIRVENADTIIFLDINKWVCIYSALKRWIANIGKVRADMGEGCKEKIDFEFIKWIYEFPKKGRVGIVGRLQNQKNKKIIILKNRKELKNWLKELAL